MKPVQGLFWVKEQSSLQAVLVDGEAGIPLMHRLMYPLRKELPGLLLELMHMAASINM